MKIKRWGMLVLLSVFRIFTCFMQRNPNKITFITLRSNALENDFKMLYDSLYKKDKYVLETILLNFNNSFIGYIQYALSCIKQLFALYSSAMIILDHNNFVVSNFKPKDVKVLQIWHASGAIKKFGNESNRDYDIQGYDSVICGSESFIKSFSRAFNVHEKQVCACGIPRTDKLYDVAEINKNRAYMLRKYPQIKGKKVVLYAPTFRGKLMYGLHSIAIDLDKVLHILGEGYVILYKMHPLFEDSLTSKEKNVICCNGIDIYTLFSVSDYLISDYSAIVFDYSLLNKPMLFYVPDFNEYKEEVGFYINYEDEIPGPMVYDEEELAKQILNDQWDYLKIKQFKDHYCTYLDGHSTQRVVALMEKMLHSK